MQLSWLIAYSVVGWIIRLGMVPIVLRRQLPPGTSLAWLSIVFFHPYIGATLYLLIGESRLGRRYGRRHEMAKQLFPQTRTKAQTNPAVALDATFAPLIRQVHKVSGMPVLPATDVDFIDNSAQMVDRLVCDISVATSQVNLLYFIFAPDQTGMRVIDALIWAAGRGASCRLLIDGVGSRPLLHRRDLLTRMRSAGIHIVTALPVHPLRRQLARMDLRNHRKLAVIDDRIAYVGSHNLINPDYGGRKGGPWHDLTARCQGPIVRELAAVFVEDWAVETGEHLKLAEESEDPIASHPIPAQVVPTGPGTPGDSFRRVFLAVVQSAQKSIILTTPYFVPDEPTLVSLLMAADRGVEVTLILPQHPDHALTAAAGRSHFEQLLRGGVRIFQFHPGLVHSKTATVDDAVAMLGSANLDVRSFILNFELSMLMYGTEVTRRLREIQQKYLADSSPLALDQWTDRALARQYSERAVALLSPLL